MHGSPCPNCPTPAPSSPSHSPNPIQRIYEPGPSPLDNPAVQKSTYTQRRYTGQSRERDVVPRGGLLRPPVEGCQVSCRPVSTSTTVLSPPVTAVPGAVPVVAPLGLFRVPSGPVARESKVRPCFPGCPSWLRRRQRPLVDRLRLDIFSELGELGSPRHSPRVSGAVSGQLPPIP